MAPSDSSPKAAALFLLFLPLLCSTIATPAVAQQLASSQAKALLRVRRLLGNPPALEPLRHVPDPCALPPTPTLTVACSGGQVTALSVLGDRDPSSALPSTFSSDALFTTLTRLPSLSRLSLVRLGMRGPLPGAKLRRLQALQVLNLTGNHLSGAVPADLARMYSLQSLVLSRNRLNGSVPSLAALQFLEELDLSHNALGPPAAFPEVGNAVERLVLAENNFTGKIPAWVGKLGQLRFMDVSGNKLQGWIPSAIFALPSLRHVDLSRNRLSGQLPPATACGGALAFVDVSSNLLTGARPACMRGNNSAAARTVLVAGNCFSDAGAERQRPSSYCAPGALAAVLPPPQGGGKGGEGKGKGGEVGMVLAVAGSVVGGALLIALVLVVVLRVVRKQHPEVSSVLPTSPAATPAKKPPVKATHKIIAPADKSKIPNPFA
ncbi:hypothetical protein PR202_gb27780 [Eleusine coracana subsp. coracana]|uniref:Uncharacterized protein n=1 Tax=Eleusine coracana subsp. coracana TaxID=191504 RepID=A0AAV5FVN6_ELECO|nr:hypothetical protein PR202_gb27780 [Eleusine coracana subsp. coracana]